MFHGILETISELHQEGNRPLCVRAIQDTSIPCTDSISNNELNIKGRVSMRESVFMLRQSEWRLTADCEHYLAASLNIFEEIHCLRHRIGTS